MKFTAKQQRAILKVVAEWEPDTDGFESEIPASVLRDEMAMQLGNAMGLSNEASLTIMHSERMTSIEKWRKAVQS
jgi:hypothetical protein